MKSKPWRPARLALPLSLSLFLAVGFAAAALAAADLTPADVEEAADVARRAALDLLLKYAVSEDGALHAEKYYRTASEEFGKMRPAFRWRQLVALARVTASEHGFPAPGYAEACRLLKV